MNLKRYATKGSSGDKAPEPNLEYKRIPKERYISQEFKKKEWEGVWKKVWIQAGLDRDVKEPGDFFTTEIGNLSIIIIKGDDNKVRAFYNVCKHRGTQLRHQNCGHTDSFKCPFHAWEYDRQGKLASVPDAETFPAGTKDSSLNLTSVHCEIWAGWVFISLNQNPIPFKSYISEIKNQLEPYHFEKMDLILDVTVEWNCNWKVGVDAFNESYHVMGTHPQLLDVLDDQNIQIDLYEIHNRYLVPFGTPSPRLNNNGDISTSLASYMDQQGLDSSNFKGTAQEVRREIQLFKRKNSQQEGYDYSGLNDDQLSDDYHYLIFPNLSLNIYSNNMMSFRHRPHPEDPNKMLFDVQMFQMAPEGETEGKSHRSEIAKNIRDNEVNKNLTAENKESKAGRIEHVYIKEGVEHTLGQVIDQDAANLPFVQKGMNSPAYEGLWCGSQERRIIHFNKVIDEYIEGRR